jgi:hypothetical protein
VSDQLHAVAALYSRKQSHVTHLIEGWVDPRIGLDDVERRKILLLPGLELRPVRIQSLLRLRCPGFHNYILWPFMGECKRDFNWWMNLLTTYTHNSELQVITALLLIVTFCKSPQHPLSRFQSTVFTSRCLAATSNNGDSSASRAQVLSSQSPMQNSTLNWLLPGWWHFTRTS